VRWVMKLRVGADLPFGPPALDLERLRHSARTPLRTVAWLLPGVALFTLFFVTGLRGLDFGFHWDEAEGQIRPAREMLARGVLLPQTSPYSYNYPGLSRWMVLWPTLPAGLRAAVETGADTARVQAAMLAALDAPGFLLTLRRMFLFVTSLSVLWVYGAALALRFPWWAALSAASGVGLSWEFAYHARFVATDGVLAQMAALVLFFLALFVRSGRAGWLRLAAVAAGLATGTKYPGAFVMLPVLMASLWIAAPRGLVAKGARVAELSALALATYLVTTPGTLLDPFRFVGELRFISTYYSRSSHGGYTVASGATHARLVLEYLGLSYFAPYHAVAALELALTLGGAWFWLRADRRTGALVVALPVVFLSYFCAKYRLVTVRNYLFVAPFLALLLGRAVAELGQRVSGTPLRRLLAVALGAVHLTQAVWLVRAGESIRRTSPKRSVREALAYVAARPDTRFRVSGKVAALASELGLALPPNARRDGRAEHVVFFGASEGPGPWSWKTNDPWLTEAVFGPREVNVNWYASWSGHDHVLVMTWRKAAGTGVPLTR
jgi:hypothetical protein